MEQRKFYDKLVMKFIMRMLDLMMTEKEILTGFCASILKGNEIGVYNGAYKVVELAAKK